MANFFSKALKCLMVPAMFSAVGCGDQKTDVHIFGSTEKLQFGFGEEVKFQGSQLPNPEYATVESALLAVSDIKPEVSFSSDINKSFEITTKARSFTPKEIDFESLRPFEGIKAHFIVQYEHDLTEKDKEELAAKGVNIFDSLGTKTYMASGNLEDILEDARYVDRLILEEKMPDNLRDREFSLWNTDGEGNKGFYVTFFNDIDKEAAENLLIEYGAEVGGMIQHQNSRSFFTVVSSVGVDSFLDNIPKLDGVQFIEEIPVPLESLNINARAATNVTILQKELPHLTGEGVKGCVYDGGYFFLHDDMEERASWGVPEEEVYYPASHATHVACSVGGDGKLSMPYLEGMCPLGWYSETYAVICDNFNEFMMLKEECKRPEILPEYREKCSYFDEEELEAYFSTFFQGMAPKVTLISHENGGCDPNCLRDTPNQMVEKYTQVILEHRVSFITNSIGENITRNGYPCENNGKPDSTSIIVDGFVYGIYTGGKGVTILFAAGNDRYPLWSNSGRCCPKDEDGQPDYDNCFDSLGAPAAGIKNGIIVGSMGFDAEGILVITDYTSWGPTNDGRIGVTVMGHGGTLENPMLSCTLRNSYIYKIGTSMATPNVAGVVALLYQAYQELYGSEPSPSLIKAILANTAQDVGNKFVDFQTGFGLVDARAAEDAIAKAGFIQGQPIEETGIIHTYYFEQKEAGPINVLMAYTDKPGVPNLDKVLVNDLDLVLVSPSGKIYNPYVLDPLLPNLEAVRGVDHRNNIEQVVIAAEEEFENGIWQVQIKGYAVVDGPQGYSIALSETPFGPDGAVILNRGDTVTGGMVIDLDRRPCRTCEWVPERTLLDDFETDTERILKGNSATPLGKYLHGFTPQHIGKHRLNIYFKDSDNKPIINDDKTSPIHHMYFEVLEEE